MSTSTVDLLKPALEAGTLRDADVFLARHLLALTGKDEPGVALAIATLSARQAEGHTCLDLQACAGQRILMPDGVTEETNATQRFRGLQAPELAAWEAALAGSGLVWRAGSPAPASPRPLVLDAANRLYFQRYFAFESRIAQVLDALARPVPFAGAAEADCERALAPLFPADNHDPHQRAAALLALRQRFAVITGGPGTGKTTTVARLLAAMVMLGGESQQRIRLAAPTGKAAMRLGSSIGRALQDLAEAGVPATLLARVPAEAVTLHRLLGSRPDQRRPRHHAGHPLALDVLVVDEASMIDVPMMARLLDALPPNARLVLLGDGDQLASVEAGAVLGDLCAAAAYAGSRMQLVNSYRFAASGGIGRLAHAINTGDTSAALAALEEDSTTAWVEKSAAALPELAGDRWAPVFEATDPTMALIALDRFRVLCALRRGPSGVLAINAQIERHLARQGLIDAAQRHYRGRPILITANDYAVQLFNGDVGIVWPDGQGKPRAWFLENNTLRSIPCNRLPPHETAYAMTVHKAQGSEFDEIALVLPTGESTAATRELLYTAVTRARRQVQLCATREVIEATISRRVERDTGLRDQLARRASQ